MEQKFYIDPIGDGTYIKIKVLCPNCGRTKRAKKIKADEPHTEKNVKCKCPIDGFDWTYTPARAGDLYVRLDTSASISSPNWVDFTIHNDKHITLSNR